MELDFIFVALFTFLGLLAGSVIAYFTGEEIVSGKNYLKLLKSIILLVVLFLFLEHIGLHYLASAAISAIILILLIKFAGHHLSEDLIAYAFFAVFIYETQGISPVYPCLVFIYGLPSASLSYHEKKGSFAVRLTKIFLDNILYPVLLIAFTFGF